MSLTAAERRVGISILATLREEFSANTATHRAITRAMDKLGKAKPETTEPEFVPPDLPKAKGVGVSGWITCDANHPFVCVYLELPTKFNAEHGEWELGKTDDETLHEKIAQAVFGSVRGAAAMRPVTITINEREKR